MSLMCFLYTKTMVKGVLLLIFMPIRLPTNAFTVYFVDTMLTSYMKIRHHTKTLEIT